jgi:hypothetical protein
MKGHLGALLTSGLAAVALALALLQAVVAFHSARRGADLPASSTQSHRYSAPGGRSGIPWLPFDKQPPANSEGRSPQPKEERRAPPPSKYRPMPQAPGPRAPRKLAA